MGGGKTSPFLDYILNKLIRGLTILQQKRLLLMYNKTEEQR